MKQVAGTLRLDLASYREKQAFSQFGSDLDATTQYQLNHGAHTMELLKQQRYSALDVRDQVIAIFAAKEDFLDDIDLDHVGAFRDDLAVYMAERHPKLRNSIMDGKISDKAADRLRLHIKHFKEKFLDEHPNKVVEDVLANAENPSDLTADQQGSKQE